MNSEVNTLDSIFVAAHELKAPLALMRQLALSLDPSDPKTTKDYQDKLISVSDRALKQVSDLAKVARLEDGLFAMEPVAVRGVCDEVTAELEYLFRFKVLATSPTELCGYLVWRLTVELAEGAPLFLYASERSLGGLLPKAGDEIEGQLWLCGHLADAFETWKC